MGDGDGTGHHGGLRPPGEPGLVALTFDDGPVAETAELLDLLRATGVRATFLLMGSSVARHPEIVRRMADEGHAVGNHSYDHRRLTRLGFASIRDELNRTNDLIASATGKAPKLFRPPYGATNSRVEQVTAELGMAQILWGVDPSDWKDHDSDTTRAAYPGIIAGLQSRGFGLVTVPELLGDTLVPGGQYRSR